LTLQQSVMVMVLLMMMVSHARLLLQVRQSSVII
jgi:hypothetical protein